MAAQTITDGHSIGSVQGMARQIGVNASMRVRNASAVRWLGGLTINVFFILLYLVSGTDISVTLLVAVWVNITWVAAGFRRSAAFLLMYLVAFFVLLISQPALEQVFRLVPSQGTPVGLPDTIRILQISLVSTMAAYGIWTFCEHVLYRFAHSRRLYEYGGLTAEADSGKRAFRRALLHVSENLLYWAAPIAAIGPLVLLGSLGIQGYAHIRTVDYVVGGRGILAILSEYASGFVMLTYSSFLAAGPSKVEMKRPTLVVVALMLLKLLTGSRSGLVVFVMFLFGYMYARRKADPAGDWLSRKDRKLLTMSGVLLLPVLTVVESLRGVGKSATLIDFLYNQGVSVRVIDNVVAYGYLLPEQFYLAPFVHTGLVARLFNFTVYQGQTIERAMMGGSLSHTLSLYVLGEGSYLAGLGSGTSFVAEGYMQYGFAGVVLVSTVLGCVLAWVDSFVYSRPSASFVKLLIVPLLIWAPRGEFTGFIATLVTPANIVGGTVVMVLASLKMKDINSRYQMDSTILGD